MKDAKVVQYAVVKVDDTTPDIYDNLPVSRSKKVVTTTLDINDAVLKYPHGTTTLHLAVEIDGKYYKVGKEVNFK